MIQNKKKRYLVLWCFIDAKHIKQFFKNKTKKLKKLFCAKEREPNHKSYKLIENWKMLNLEFFSILVN